MIGLRPQGMFANGAPPLDPSQPQPTIGAGYSGPSAAMPPPAQPSFFGNGGVGRNIAGAIGDYLLQQAHMQPIYAPLQQQARAQTFAQQQYQQRRADTQTDWLAQQEWERAHPKPVNNDTVADFDFITQQLGPEAAKQFLTTKTTAPPFVQHNADGTLSVYPAGMVPRGGGAPASGPMPGTIEGGFRFKGGNPSDQNAWEPVGGAGVQAPARFPTSAVMPALIQAESSGRPGILGPQTPYGRAQGLTQVLPATGQQMAQKLGVPWRPDLMTGTTPDAAQYQTQIGRAYYEQGAQATGNTRDALRYYHGGSNRAQWGPKTNSYADHILAALGGGQNNAAPPPALPMAGSDQGYQHWLQKYGIREDPTYDTRAAFQAGLKPDSRGHLNDKYKLPNHPTFSDESIHNGEAGAVGGKWIQTTAPSKQNREGVWSFQASPYNLQNMSKPDLKAYFDKVEPGTTVIFPDGERYTGGQR